MHCEERDSPTKRRSGQVDRLNFPKGQARTFSNLVVPLPIPRIIRLSLADRSRVLPFYIWCVYTAAVSPLQQPIWLRFSYRIKSIVDTTTTVREYHLCLILKSRGLPCWKYFIWLGRLSGRIRGFDRDISLLFFLFFSVRLFLSIFCILQESTLKNTFLFLRLTVVHVSKTLSTPFVGPLGFPLRRLCSISS